MKQEPAFRLGARAWVALLLLGIVFWFFVQNYQLILEMAGVLFGSLLIGVALRPVADFMAVRRVPRGAAVIAVYVLVLGSWALAGNLLVPIIDADLAYFRTHGLGLVQTALGQIAAMPVINQFLPAPSSYLPSLAQRINALAAAVVNAVASIGGMALDVLLAMVLGYFFAADTTLGMRTFLAWTPPAYQEAVGLLLGRIRRRLTRWIWAQLAVALYFAVVFTIGLSLFGIRFALTIGLIGGMLEVIPYVGGMTAWLLAVFSALTSNPWLALWVTVFYLVVVEVESHIVAPAFYGRVLDIHPALVLMALVVGAKLGGIVGLLFAVPLMVVLTVVVGEVRTLLRFEEERGGGGPTVPEPG